MKVLEIVQYHLAQRPWFHGLVSADGECGCPAGRLAPCGEIKGDCQVAVRVPCDGSCGAALGCGGHFRAPEDAYSEAARGEK